ncbi:MAG: hypothetical protein ACE5FD_08245, partial [Anaerolineae bacterium]
MKRIFPFISIIIGLAMLMAACGSLPELPPTRTTEESGDTAVDTTEAAPPTQDEPAAATDTQNSQPEPAAEPSTNSGGESSASSDTTDTVQAVSASSGNGAAIKAVDLLEAWVNAGASEQDAFDYVGFDGNTYQGSFETDVLPLFTTKGIWYDGSRSCDSCHFANSAASAHEMDLSSYEGIMTGGDALSDPPGVPLLGQSEFGDTDYNWGDSKLRGRLRNNRMPPGWEFDITEGNRDGYCVEVTDAGVNVLFGEYGCELNAVGLIGAWVDAGASETDSFSFGGGDLNFERDVQPFFTENEMWYEGSQACGGCHFANSENSYHEMDLSTYEGMMSGGDVLSEPPGVPIFGQSEVGATDFNWGESKLRARLRNNRMPPGWEFDITEGNRDGPWVLHGERVDVSELASADTAGNDLGSISFTTTTARTMTTITTTTIVQPDGTVETTSVTQVVVFDGEGNATTATGGEGAFFGTGECQVKAVDLIGAWVDSGAPETDSFSFTSLNDEACSGDFANDVQPLFTENNAWYEGSQACASCHFANSENSYHEMDLSTYEGMMSGGDV